MNNILGRAECIKGTSAESIALLFDKVLMQQPKGIFVLCCDGYPEKSECFEQFLKDLPLPVFGGVFPGVIFDNKVMEEGVVVIPILVPVEVKVYSELVSAQSATFDFSPSLSSCQSLMVLVDGLSRNIDYTLNQLFQQFGQGVCVFGGGAGSLSFAPKPCLISNDGLLKDAMIVVAMERHWNLAVGHGWDVLEGPFLANQVDDNRIIQLNFQAASSVYKDVIERHENKTLTEENFFDLAKTYPFGLDRLDDDLLVRDPVTVEGDSLICVGKIPENTMLYILKGNRENLISTAVQAVQGKVASKNLSEGILFDCISRKLFLEEDFSSELEQMSLSLGGDRPVVGALVIGEIASSLSGAINFHNKTAVMAIASGSEAQI